MAAGQEQARAGARREVGAQAVAPSRLDHPPAVVQRGGDVQRRRAAVLVPGVQGGRHRGRGVDHHEVAGREEIGQVAEAMVRHPAGSADEQPHRVAGRAAPLRGLPRLAVRRQREPRRGLGQAGTARGAHAPWTGLSAPTV